MKKVLATFLFFQLISNSEAQQLPYYSQFRTNQFVMNPAVTGTKKFVDARISYRKQWVGYEGAPITKGFSLNSRYFKGKMGTGFFLTQDETGPTKRTFLDLAYAFHIRYPDIELSFGLAGNMTRYEINGTLITIHNSQDKAIAQNLFASDWVGNASAGLLLYNDRFHFGVSALNLLGQSEKYYEGDTVKEAGIKMPVHSVVSVGYNWSGNPYWIWENSVQVIYIQAAPFTVDYKMRVHYKEKIFGGFSFRPSDAISLETGVTIKGEFQIAYSYDIVTSKLRKYESGTHEIMLVYSSNMEFLFGKKNRNKAFLREKFQYLF